MFTNNKFAKMDSIANLINTILETDTKAKMEELKGGQHKIDKNKNNKIDAHDFAILRGEKKAMKKEESEQLDEIGDTPAGKQMLGKYIKKAARRVGVHASVASQYADTAGSETATPSQRRAASTLALNQKHKRDMRLRGVERATDRMTKEETEQVDEAKEPGFRASYGIGRKGTVAKKPETYGKRVQGKGYDKPENERKGPEGNVAMTSLMPGHDERAAKFLARQAKGKLVKGKAQSAKQMEKEEIDPKKTMTDTLKGREKDSSNPFLSKKVMMDVPGNVKEDIEQVDERTLTAPETAEKERIVKGMKKSLAGFKSRYGERAKSVMYATATKAAKERK